MALDCISGPLTGSQTASEALDRTLVSHARPLQLPQGPQITSKGLSWGFGLHPRASDRALDCIQWPQTMSKGLGPHLRASDRAQRRSCLCIQPLCPAFGPCFHTSHVLPSHPSYPAFVHLAFASSLRAQRAS